jgi:hypothetical protein
MQSRQTILEGIYLQAENAWHMTRVHEYRVKTEKTSANL